ncbi:DUF2497 domain-containing protein [Qipengyuania sediminis]|uniref:DUF2497 domain-containing protein n=1 Tax=Qipengyuania sediminis TaxID=1532023 RepID=UPI0010594244|nr:DUF2497 domain-containing protein [Qipengyuania sediminis]
MQQEGERAVEEILESIKKVIARDQAALAAGSGTPARAAAAEPVDPAGPEEAEEVLELDEDAVLALAEQEDGAAGRYDEAQARDAEDDAHPLTGAANAAAMRENFAALAMLAQPGRPPQIVRSGETSLEGLTRELLRPMLAQWLDTHLPGMVEELVKAEIARIAGKRS